MIPHISEDVRDHRLPPAARLAAVLFYLAYSRTKVSMSDSCTIPMSRAYSDSIIR